MKKPSALLQLLLSFAGPAAAAVTCVPTVSPANVQPGGVITLKGNCTDTTTNLPVAQGSEVWATKVGASTQLVGQRALPNGSLSVVVPTLPGDQTYYIQSIDAGYGGQINFGGELPSVTVKINAVATASSATRDQLSTPLTSLQTSRVRGFLTQALSRLRTIRTSGSIPQLDVPGVPLPEKKNEEGEATGKHQMGVYVDGLGDYLRQDSSPNQSEFKARTSTLSVGADYRLNDDWVMGGSVGLSDSHVAFSGSASDQKSKGNHATAYASWSLSPSTYVSATLSYEASKFDVTRDDGTGQVLLASPRGHGVGLSLSGGRDFLMGPWSVGPYLRWDSVTSDVDAFDETGGSSAVSVSSQRTRSNTLNVGAQTQLSVPVSWGIVLPYVRVELSHRNDTTPRAPGATLLSDNSTLLVPSAADTSGSYGTIAAGVSGVNQGGASWFVDYESGVAQKGYRTQRLGLGLRFEL